MENLHTIKSDICTKVERKDKLFAPKWDSFCKHVGHKKTNMNIGFDVKKRINIILQSLKACQELKNVYFPQLGEY
jgi:hypothetical protein